MESPRWLRLAPLAVAVAAGALGLGRPVAGAAPAAWDPPPCPAAVAVTPTRPAGAWYRLAPVLDAGGTLAARRLTLGTAGGTTAWLDLAPESFASGPAGGRVLVGDDDGSRSRLRLLDPERACAVPVAVEAAVVRSAVIIPDGSAIVEHRVDRATRADLGVWRRPLGGAAPVRLLAGLDPDPAFGPTFTTDLLVAEDGRLVVSSCGLEACRVRVLDPSTGGVALVRGTGPALGVTGTRAIVRAVCPGEPCPVEAVDLASGARTELVHVAHAAVLGGPSGDRVVASVPGGAVVVVDVGSGRRTLPDGLLGHPLRLGSTSVAGAETPPGAVAVQPDGGPGDPSLRVLDRDGKTSSSLEEAVR